MGFAGVLAGPLVRSSYRAGRLYAQAMEQRPPAARTLAVPGASGQPRRPFRYRLRDSRYAARKPYAAWCWLTL